MIDLLHTFLLPILFTTGLVAGTVDAIAGGGGLITLPILLGTGLPPHLVLGTNKLRSSIGTLASTTAYYRHGLFSLKGVAAGLIAGITGSTLGSIGGQVLDNSLLRKIIPILLLIMLGYTLFSSKLDDVEKPPRLNTLPFYLIFGFILGLYDGFFGPGVGALWVFALTFFLGQSLTKATAHTKIFNFNSNIIATACFALGGNIDYRLALYMAVGQLIGGKLGAHLAIKNGAELIRPIFLLMVGVTISTLIYKNFATSGNIGIFVIIAIPIFISIALLYRQRQKT